MTSTPLDMGGRSVGILLVEVKDGKHYSLADLS